MSRVLSEFARTLATDFPIQAILDHLVVRIVDVLPIDGPGVTLMDAAGQAVFVSASDDQAMTYERIQADVLAGPCTLAYRTGLAVEVPDLRADDRFPGFTERALMTGLRAVFTFPLRQGDVQIGALDLYRTSAGALDPARRVAAQTLADVAAAYLINARARVDLEESIEQARVSAQHDAESVQALRASEQRNTSILASALDAVVTVDAHGTVLEFNPAAAPSFGRSETEAVGPLADLVDPPPLAVATGQSLTRSSPLGMGRRLGAEKSCSHGAPTGRRFRRR